jgi:hypothetical protein
VQWAVENRGFAGFFSQKYGIPVALDGILNISAAYVKYT